MELQPCYDKYASFLDTGRHSDFEIGCRGHVIKVHKAIICAKSEYFDRVCSSDFSEGVNARIDLDDDEPALVARMILFMYINTYRDESDIASEIDGQRQFSRIVDNAKAEIDASWAEGKDTWPAFAKLHVLMYAMGDKYSIPSLCKQSTAIFVRDFRTPERDVHRWDDDSPDSLTDVWEPRAALMRLIYTSTPSNDRGLKDIVLFFVLLDIANPNILLLSPLESKAMAQAMEDIPELALEIATSTLSRRPWTCQVCKEPMRLLARRCQCGKIDSCEVLQCLGIARASAVCTRCYCVGTAKRQYTL